MGVRYANLMSLIEMNGISLSVVERLDAILGPRPLKNFPSFF